MPLLLLIITASVFLSYYFLLIRFKVQCPHQKIILAGLFGFSQIILTQLFLGIVGLLYLPAVIFFNVGIFLMVAVCSRVFEKDPYGILREEYRRLAGSFRNAFAAENAFLLALGGGVLLWIAIVIYLFPVREYDSVTYHLPPICQYIINHRISLLPVEINKRFAFPENAELLFMWPMIFLHSQQFVNTVQLVMVLWGVVVIYGLARLLGITSKIAFFVSLLFFFTPIVVPQIGTCYIDCVMTVFILTVLYCAAMFYRSNRLLYFYSTALAAGLLWGMKYNGFLFILMVTPFLWGRRGIRLKHWAVFFVILLVAGGFWYLRNFWIFKTPVYPALFSHEASGVFPYYSRTVNPVEFLMLIPSKFLLLWKDVGLGSFNGGYGLIFWGMALPAWFYIWSRSILQKNKFDFWVYLPLVVGIGQLMFPSLDRYEYLPRYSIFIVAIGLLALGQVMVVFTRFDYFRKGIKVLCIIFAVIAIVRGDDDFGWGIEKPIKDIVAGKYISRQSYCWGYENCQVWGALDYLTVNDPKGLTVYLASGNWINPVNVYGYGTKLQNRIWNIQKDKSFPPDAFLFVNIAKDANLSKIYRGGEIALKDVMVNSEFILIERTDNDFLFIRKNFFKDSQKQQLLNKYYRIMGEKRPVLAL